VISQYQKLATELVFRNPFGQTPQGAIVCFDAKIAFDENAKFRHEELFTSFDRGEEDPREVEAAVIFQYSASSTLLTNVAIWAKLCSHGRQHWLLSQWSGLSYGDYGYNQM